MGTKIEERRERRVAGTVRCQSAVESPHMSGVGPKEVDLMFFRIKIKKVKNEGVEKGWKRAPGFREVVLVSGNKNRVK